MSIKIKKELSFQSPCKIFLCTKDYIQFKRLELWLENMQSLQLSQLARSKDISCLVQYEGSSHLQLVLTGKLPGRLSNSAVSQNPG